MVMLDPASMLLLDMYPFRAVVWLSIVNERLGELRILAHSTQVRTAQAARTMRIHDSSVELECTVETYLSCPSIPQVVCLQ